MKSPEEILAFFSKNIDYLEHGTRKEKSGFWPHKCSECLYALEVDCEEYECRLNCLRYRDLSLVEYISLRIEEQL